MNPHDKPPTTIDELLEYPTSSEQMTDKELESFLRPYFPHTRPAKLISALADKQERMSVVMTDEQLLEKARAVKAAKLAAAAQQRTT